MTEISSFTNGFNGIETSDQFLSKYNPAEYVIDGVMQTGMTYALTGYTGHAKTSATLYLCNSILYGWDFGGHEVEPGAVLFLAGENSENVRSQWIAACDYHNVNPCNSNMHWHDGYFDINACRDLTRDQASKIPNLRLIVADTLQAFFAGDSDNDNTQMIDAARSFRSLGNLPSKPAVLIPAHPSGKKPEPTNLVPRGGTAFMNEIDGNYTIWNGGEGVLQWWSQGKHRGAPFDRFSLKLTEWDKCKALEDRRGRIPSIGVVGGLSAVELRDKLNALEIHEIQTLRHIQRFPKMRQRERADAMGINQSSVSRRITALSDMKAIKKVGHKLALTGIGEEILRDANEAANAS